MSTSDSPALSGRVASLHLHPAQGGAPLTSVDFVEVVAGKGILGNPRYFDRLSRTTGQPSRRQVSLIGREQITEHATALALQSIAPGAVRANIETSGLDLIALLGAKVQIGEAILLFYEARMPCSKMDAICVGLRALMADQRQGVMAEVIQSGRIRVGDSISPVQ
ncbi:MAG: MOSC domain-containing protein [Verrucomicrobia bacterium]|nr:MOSC domain-containing protein [Verrucomicrobiota bacterium]